MIRRREGQLFGHFRNNGQLLARLAPFEQVFDGTTFEQKPGTSGTYLVKRGPYQEVIVKNGRIHALVYQTGARRTIDYTAVGDHYVPTTLRLGDETVRARYKDMCEWLVPYEFRFEKVFGRNWGPETIKISGMRVR